MKNFHHISWLYTAVILCAVIVGSQRVESWADLSDTRSIITLPAALKQMSNYMHYLVTTYHLPHTPHQQEEDLQTTEKELIDYSLSNDHGELYIKRIQVERLEESYQKTLMLLYPKYFEESKIAQNGTYSVKLAKERVRAEILNSCNLGSSPPEIHKRWKQIERDFVNPELSKETFIECFDDQKLPIVTEKNLELLIEKTKHHIEKQQSQQGKQKKSHNRKKSGKTPKKKHSKKP